MEIEIEDEDFINFMIACKTGVLEQVRFYVEVKRLNVNAHDTFDATALYYACLCGHINLVQYLLEKGSRCEENTFDGERCLYAAHNDDIRKLLKRYRVVVKYDPFMEFLKKSFNNENAFPDFCFIVKGKPIYVHKFILSARCEYFAKMFQTKWNGRKTTHLKNHLVDYDAFVAVLKYLYCGKLEIPAHSYQQCALICLQCKLDILPNLEQGVNRHKWIVVDTTNNNAQARDGPTPLQVDLLQGFYALLPTFGNEESNHSPSNMHPDVAFLVEGHIFYCHKVFVCGRCDYFDKLLNGHFKEALGKMPTDNNIPIVELRDISHQVFAVILEYLYTDGVHGLMRRAQDNFDELFMEVLRTADLLLLNDLKHQCITIISLHMDEDNVFEMMQIAKVFELPRLEDHCTKYLALHLDSMLYRQEFADLIRQDAAAIKNRQETDTIPVVDEIRGIIEEMYSVVPYYEDDIQDEMFSKRVQMKEKLLAGLDMLLESLGFGC